MVEVGPFSGEPTGGKGVIDVDRLVVPNNLPLFQARTQLRQRRLDGAVQGSETLPYIMNLEKGTFKPLDKAFSFQYTGMALGKDAGELTTAIQAAINAMIADGSYQKILSKWGLSDNGIAEATVNQG